MGIYIYMYTSASPGVSQLILTLTTTHGAHPSDRSAPINDLCWYPAVTTTSPTEAVRAATPRSANPMKGVRQRAYSLGHMLHLGLRCARRLLGAKPTASEFGSAPLLAGQPATQPISQPINQVPKRSSPGVHRDLWGSSLWPFLDSPGTPRGSFPQEASKK